MTQSDVSGCGMADLKFLHLEQGLLFCTLCFSPWNCRECNRCLWATVTPTSTVMPRQERWYGYFYSSIHTYKKNFRDVTMRPFIYYPRTFSWDHMSCPFYLMEITRCLRLAFRIRDMLVRIRMRIREAQKLMDPMDPEQRYIYIIFQR